MITRILATAARKGPFTKMREGGRNDALNQLTCLPVVWQSIHSSGRAEVQKVQTQKRAARINFQRKHS
jgi:hypothetical protein